MFIPTTTILAVLLSALPPSLFASAPPAAAQPVAAAKAVAVKGEPIVVRGLIGGTARPIVEGRAVFTIVDPSLPTCAAKEDDHCATPWDYCCEKREDIVANSATVQLVDESGRPLAESVSGARGLLPMSEVVVAGTVAATDRSKVLLVNAKELFVARVGGCAFEAGAAPAAPRLAEVAGGLHAGTTTFRAILAPEPFGPEGTISVVDGTAVARLVVHDFRGHPIKTSLTGINGLKGGDAVVIEATAVESRDGGRTLVAQRVWRG